MLVPESEWIYAPHLMFDARRVLASVLPFTERVHAEAYSIPAIAVDLGAEVSYRRDPSLDLLGMCARRGEGMVITLNDAIEFTEYDMPGLIHEIGHAVISEASLRCTLALRRLEERNAWVRGIYVAISRVLVEGITSGNLTVRDVASRCSVPLCIVRARLALATIMRERPGHPVLAYEDLRAELLTVEQWIEDGRSHGFREWHVA